MPQFIFLIREDLNRYPMPKEQLDEIVAAHVNWAKDLSARGIFKSGAGIKSSGKLLHWNGSEMLEGDLRDKNEGVGGYYIIEAADMEAAIQIARECPTYKSGDKIEVRELGM